MKAQARSRSNPYASSIMGLGLKKPNRSQHFAILSYMATTYSLWDFFFFFFLQRQLHGFLVIDDPLCSRGFYMVSCYLCSQLLRLVSIFFLIVDGVDRLVIIFSILLVCNILFLSPRELLTHWQHYALYRSHFLVLHFVAYL